MDKLTDNFFTLEQEFGLNQLEIIANNLEKPDLIEMLLTERRSVYILQCYIGQMIREDLETLSAAIADEENFH